MDICVSLYVNSMRSVIVLIKLLCMYVCMYDNLTFPLHVDMRLVVQ